MSLEFNRRSFLKYSAAAAVVVAGSSLLTGCGDDEYQPTGKLGSTLKLMGEYKLTPAKIVDNSVGSSVTTATTAAGTTVASTFPATDNKYTLLCDLSMKCTSKYGLNISQNNFQVEVKSGSSTTYYHPSNASPLNGISLTYNNFYLDKDGKKGPETLDTTLVVKDIVLKDGDTVKVKFWPRPVASEGTQAYTRAFVTWTLTVDSAEANKIK